MLAKREELIDCLMDHWIDCNPDSTKSQQKIQWYKLCQYSNDDLKKTCFELNLIRNVSEEAWRKLK